MKNQIKKVEDMVGKTIKGSAEYVGDLYIAFTDGTFVVLNVEDESSGFGHSKHMVAVDDYEKDRTEHVLVELGIITQAEYEEAVLQEEIEREERYKKYEEEQEEQRRQYELEQLSKLKEKYENE